MSNDQLIALFGVILPIIAGAIGGYIGYMRGRTAAFREKLYDKQIEAYQELISGAYSVLKAATSLSPIDAPFTDDQIITWRSHVDEIVDDYYQLIQKYSIFVEGNVRDDIYRFMRVVVDYMFQSDDYTFENILTMNSQIHDANEQVIDNIYTALGTEQLSQQIKELIGNNAKKPKK